MNKKVRAGYKRIPFAVIQSAVSGDIDAINIVLTHYSGYIAALSTRKFYDDQGILKSCVDESLRSELESKLVSKILEFRLI